MTRIDRRALFTSGAAAALLTASGVSLDAAPRRGGRLRLAVPRDDDSLNKVARGAVFDTLTEITPQGVLQGSLATGWRSSADARDWQFDLRGDVRFHDDAPLTAEDAAASLLALNPEGLSAAEPIGPLQLRVSYKAGKPGLPFLLADPEMIIARDGAVDTDLDSASGTGLYRVRRVQSGRHFLGDRAGKHFRESRSGWAESIEIVVIPDAGVRAEALSDGFVDIAVLPNPSGLLGRGDFVFHPSPSDIALAAHRGVGVPARIGTQSPLDDGRIAERWWLL